ncbi:hypothetical protein CEXT_430361 [Caerostris extrusa]|uniref:Uncharacterized protein n=1 Tax=Caerostris extrusa TaxID=172846 RepID=A0AAV4XR71_CAEEX|nr:hypothetical protein CEXT_430361 [Caerostris extrusa]
MLLAEQQFMLQTQLLISRPDIHDFLSSDLLTFLLTFPKLPLSHICSVDAGNELKTRYCGNSSNVCSVEHTAPLGRSFGAISGKHGPESVTCCAAVHASDTTAHFTPLHSRLSWQ